MMWGLQAGAFVPMGVRMSTPAYNSSIHVMSTCQKED